MAWTGRRAAAGALTLSRFSAYAYHPGLAGALIATRCGSTGGPEPTVAVASLGTGPAHGSGAGLGAALQSMTELGARRAVVERCWRGVLAVQWTAARLVLRMSRRPVRPRAGITSEDRRQPRKMEEAAGVGHGGDDDAGADRGILPSRLRIIGASTPMIAAGSG